MELVTPLKKETPVQGVWCLKLGGFRGLTGNRHVSPLGKSIQGLRPFLKEDQVQEQ